MYMSFGLEPYRAFEQRTGARTLEGMGGRKGGPRILDLVPAVLLIGWSGAKGGLWLEKGAGCPEIG